MSASQIVALVGILFLALGLRLEDVHQPLVDFFSWREASTAMMADNLPANGWNPLWPEVSWTGDQPGYQGREFQTLTIAAAISDGEIGMADSWRHFAASFPPSPFFDLCHSCAVPGKDCLLARFMPSCRARF